MEKTKSSFFDPETSFFELRIVRLTALSFILTFLMMCFLIVFMSNLWGKWDLTYLGFNNLLEYFKVPLGFLALIIPVGAVYAANHRSEQTKKQIYLTHQQNLFTNYYKHIEEFEKFSNARTENLMVNEVLPTSKSNNSLLDIRAFHKALFPDLIVHGKIQANRELLQSLEDSFDLRNLTQLSHQSSLFEIRTTLVDLTQTLRETCSEHNLGLGVLMYFELMKKVRSVAEYEQLQLQIRGESELRDISDSCNLFIIVDAIERITLTLRFIEVCAKFDTSFVGMKCLLPLGFLSSRISDEQRIKALKQEYFSEDTIPANEPHVPANLRVSRRTLAENIYQGLNFPQKT